MTFRIRGDLRRRLRIAAAQQDREMQDIAAEALTAWLERNNF
jgi:predicted transcriptional regulator